VVDEQDLRLDRLLEHRVALVAEEGAGQGREREEGRGELAPYRLMTKASDRCVGFPATRWRGEDQTLCVVLFVIKEGAHGRQRGRGARGLESCVDVTLGDPPPLRE